MPPAVVPPKALPIPAPAIPKTETPPEATKDIITVEIAGRDINIPSPQAVVQASATAVVGTSATLVTALVFNQVRTAAAPVLQKLARDKFKIKLKSMKPVLHFVEEEGEVHVIEYSEEGVKVLNTHVQNPEQYLRDLIDADHLFETDHKIIIDEPVKERFTKEGAKRFNYFISAKKLAKRMAAKFTFG
jgi:Fe2+ or Zn2+ uptake regulation protein